MRPVPLEDVATHTDVTPTTIYNYWSLNPPGEKGLSKYRASIPRGVELEALLLNNHSDTLVVSLHGATNRGRKSLPRFEWFRTLRKTEYSSLYFSDPCLQLDPGIELSWYTGWREFDLYPLLADWTRSAAAAIGATNILFTGSSGGGFAALQVATLIPGSVALPFSPQTSISKYKVRGTSFAAQRSYLRVVMPDLEPEQSLHDLDKEQDWGAPLGGRLSAVTRYQEDQQNYVHYVQNRNDYWHYVDHFLPFRNVVEKTANSERVRFNLYEGPYDHNPPRAAVFYEALDSAAQWAHENGGSPK